MLEGAVARRYARALFELAREKGRLEEVQSELHQVRGMFSENPSLQQTFERREVPPADRKAIVDRVFAGQPQYVRNLLKLLVDKRREDFLAEIAAQFGHLVDEAAGVVEVEVRSAVPLEQGELEALRQGLARSGRPNVRLQARTDGELIGGVVLRIGDRLYDGSLSTRLRVLRDRLAR